MTDLMHLLDDAMIDSEPKQAEFDFAKTERTQCATPNLSAPPREGGDYADWECSCPVCTGQDSDYRDDK